AGDVRQILGRPPMRLAPPPPDRPEKDDGKGMPGRPAALAGGEWVESITSPDGAASALWPVPWADVLLDARLDRPHLPPAAVRPPRCPPSRTATPASSGWPSRTS